MATPLILPPTAILEETAHTMAEQARSAGNTSREQAITKALVQLSRGTQIVVTFGALLVESRTSAGQLYRVSHESGCSCKAAQAGRICWHSALVEIITEAQARAVPAVSLGQRLANARKSREQVEAEMNELFA